MGAPLAARRLNRPLFDIAELAGAVADLGVLVPIAVALIVKNGLTPSAVLLPAGLLYIMAGLIYRVPVPVQPLKAFGAIAIAKGLGSSEIAAGALLMGGVFVVLGAAGWLDRVAKVFPHPIIRGVQLSVGLLFCQLAWTLVTAPPTAFTDHTRPIWWLLGAAAVEIGRPNPDALFNHFRRFDERAGIHSAAPSQIAPILRDRNNPAACKIDETHVAAPSSRTLQILLENASKLQSRCLRVLRNARD